MSDAYERGRQAWRDGAGRPEVPGDDAPKDEQLFYVGFVMEVAGDFYRRRSIALFPDRIEPRP